MRVSAAIANFGRFRRQPTGRLQFVRGRFWNSPQNSPINTSLRVALRCFEHQLFQRRWFPTWAARIVKSSRKLHEKTGSFLFYFRMKSMEVATVLACRPEGALRVCAP
ncbi:unnamed protein product [Amoebophrya sp. A25]|nr:unnamed protein product [Amoebophrya sp. A25]|eukprot:GSA25T00002635001.1